MSTNGNGHNPQHCVWACREAMYTDNIHALLITCTDGQVVMRYDGTIHPPTRHERRHITAITEDLGHTCSELISAGSERYR